jgi:hypothetical protein
MFSQDFEYDPDAPPSRPPCWSEARRPTEGKSAEHSFKLDDDPNEVAARGLAALEAYDSDSDDSSYNERKEGTRYIAQQYEPSPSPTWFNAIGRNPAHLWCSARLSSSLLLLCPRTIISPVDPQGFRQKRVRRVRRRSMLVWGSETRVITASASTPAK